MGRKSATTKRQTAVLNNSCGKKWEPVLREFIMVKKAQGAAPRTISDYERHVTKLFKDYNASLDDIDQLYMASLEYISAPNIAPATHNLRLQYLKTFLFLQHV